MHSRLPIAMTLLLSLPALAASPEYVVAVNASKDMPLHQYQDRQLVGGIVKDIGEALAQRLGRTPRFALYSRKRIEAALASGEADVLCYSRPEWVSIKLNWSSPLFFDQEILLARPKAPVVHRFKALADQPVGTVLGYHYQEIERELGPRFVQDKAPDETHNYRKLVGGRFQYAIISQMSYQYLQKVEPATPPLRQDMAVSRFAVFCGFSPRSQVPFAQARQAMESLVADGSIKRILAKYR